MGIIYLLGTGFTIWMAVDAVRRGQAGSWLWIILMFPFIGAAAYCASQYGDDLLSFAGMARSHGRRVTAADLRQAEIEVRRLDNAATWLDLAMALRARKEYKRAVAAAQSSVERDASSIHAQYELALALIACGRGAEAAAPLERVVAKNRSFDAEGALFRLGQARQAAGDVEGARALLAEVGSRTALPEYLYEWASVEARLGHRDQAIKALQRIVNESELAPKYLRRSVRPWARKAQSALRHLGS